jgi:hypothetical protein
MTKPDVLLWLGDNRGQYIPRDFANSFVDRGKSVSGVTPEDWAILEAGPDHELYWDTWDAVLNRAIVTDEKGVRHRVEQDGDCWLVPEGMIFDDNEGWRWPVDEALTD